MVAGPFVAFVRSEAQPRFRTDGDLNGVVGVRRYHAEGFADQQAAAVPGNKMSDPGGATHDPR
jgi:hypothetical protein